MREANMEDDKLRRARGIAERHLCAIASLFQGSVEVALVVTRPQLPEQDFVLVSGSVDAAIEALQRSKERRPS